MLSRIQTTDQEIQLIQDNVDKALTPLQSIPMVGGAVVSTSLISGQDNLIRHGLGRLPKLFLVGNLNANSVVWSPDTSTLNNASSDSIFINLRCSSDCTISLWVA